MPIRPEDVTTRRTKHDRFLNLETQHIEQRICVEALADPALANISEDAWNDHVLERVCEELYISTTTRMWEILNGDPYQVDPNAQRELKRTYERLEALTDGNFTTSM